MYDMYLKTTGASSHLPSYGGGGFGRGVPLYGGAAAPSEVSVGSSSFSYRSDTRSGQFENGTHTVPPALVGRGFALGRGQHPPQNAGVGKDVVFVSRCNCLINAFRPLSNNGACQSTGCTVFLSFPNFLNFVLYKCTKLI